MKKIEVILRIGVFGTFLGHGIFAYMVKPEWLNFLIVAGIPTHLAPEIMQYIGLLDIIVAFTILIHPIKIVIIWAIFWTLATALIRPISGLPIWDFVERAANWAVPTALFLIKGWPRSFKDLWR